MSTNQQNPSQFPENSRHHPPGSAGQRSPLRRLGARRPLALGAHEAVPRDGGEEDRSASTAPSRRVSPAVREGAHPPALPRPRDGRATDPCTSL